MKRPPNILQQRKDKDATRPNILVVLDDQHRHDFIGYAGADFVHTPHIDSLARRGVAFTHCCTNSPVCGPARIALATGLIPTRTGTTSNQTAFMPISTPNHYRHFRDPTIYKTVSITEAETAHSLLEKGQNIGKVVLLVKEEE